MQNMKRGITFIESLVWVAVFVVSMMALIVSLLSFYRANNYTLDQAQAVSDARRAIDRVVQTLREATYSSEGAYPIIAMSTSSITFYADVDADPLIERVRYFLSGTALKRGVVDPSGDPPAYTAAEVIATTSEHIRNLELRSSLFTYLDESGATITNLTDVAALRFVTVEAVVNVKPERLPNELTIRSAAALRNLENAI